MFDPGMENLRILIPMRKYKNRTVWDAVWVEVAFQRKSRYYGDKITEVFYHAFEPKVVFRDNESLSPIPELK
jgi:hypothetical protein